MKTALELSNMFYILYLYIIMKVKIYTHFLLYSVNFDRPNSADWLTLAYVN